MPKRINRRRFLGSSAAAALAAVFPYPLKALAEGRRRGSNRRSESYNVLFMTADDLGWKDLSCYGNGNLSTPHLDSLAAAGLRFDRAFGVSSSCSSSRASFITGQYISTHGVDGLVHRHLGRQLAPLRRTMPRYFKRAGYHSAIEGKWHVSLLPTSLYGYTEAIGSSLMWKRHIVDGKKTAKFFRERARDGKPFYLELNFTDTHRNAKGKFEPDPAFVVDPSTIRVPDWMGLPDLPEIREDLARYYSGVRKTDHLVGLALKELRSAGLEENTIVVFVSDNGSPFPGNKMSLLDRGIGTPLLIRWPGKVKAGRVSDALVSTIDLMPTLLNLCGLSHGDEVEGLSFAPLLLDESVDRHRDHVMAEMNYHVHHVPMRAVRTERWKAIRNLTDTPLGLGDAEDEPWARRLAEVDGQTWLQRRVPFELYDLSNDPNETRNLTGRPEVALIEAELRKRLGA